MVSKRIRSRVFYEKGCYCHDCGWEPEDEKSKSIIHIHHKDGNDENNDMGNLIPLCNSCHQKRHGGVVDRYTVGITKKGLREKEIELIEEENRLLSWEYRLNKKEKEILRREREIERREEMVDKKEFWLDERKYREQGMYD